MTDDLPSRASARAAERRAPSKHRISVFGVAGELLITAGMVVLLFLAWQLWWNDMIMAGSQANAASSQSQEWIKNAETAPAPEPTIDATGAPNYGEPPVTARPAPGDPFAVLYVPRYGADYRRVVAEGVDTATVLNSFDLGVGHYPSTQMPGEVGNFVVAGHRKAYGGAMTLISDLQIGDKVYVQTADGYYTYVFRNITYVLPTQVDVLNPVPQVDGVAPTQRILTLTTCNPLYSTAERSIAYAVYESWQPLSAGPPAEIAASVAAAGG
ncbi:MULTISPECIES: class E sortase [unclassified Plantibacter]|uniref:class E sortase n=1 Tax=unclassified Plantibacter TaxID=2624265 RepID=UPI0011102629|nr:class E sortase [Plantibacter sp. M259]MBF4564508.1 class E sortase [Plantibacter sp. VKM Ac-2876]